MKTTNTQIQKSSVILNHKKYKEDHIKSYYTQITKPVIKRNLKTSQRKKDTLYRVKSIRMITDFSFEIMLAKTVEQYF